MPPSATRNYLQDKGYNVAAAVTKFRAVKWSAAETVTPVTAITDMVAGVVQHDVTAGEILRGKGASIAVEGDTMWEAAGAITVGQRVSIAADGRCKAFGAGERLMGWCVEAASGASKYARIHLQLNGDIAGTA
jgi:uncharacterized protein DUF2190